MTLEMIIFRFLCSCHAQVRHSSKQAARMKKEKFLRKGLWKADSDLWLKAEKCKMTRLGEVLNVEPCRAAPHGLTTSLPTQRLKLIALDKTWRFICRTDQKLNPNRAKLETELVLTVSSVSGVPIAVRSKATTCRQSTQLRCSMKPSRSVEEIQCLRLPPLPPLLNPLPRPRPRPLPLRAPGSPPPIMPNPWPCYGGNKRHWSQTEIGNFPDS